MSCIVYQTDRKTGNVHAYSSVSHRDPVTKKVKTAKTYLGRVDPVTNEIIPKAEKGKRNRGISTKLRESITKEAQKKVDDLQAQVNDLQDQLKAATAKIAKYQKAFEAFKKAIADIDEQD